MAWSLPFLDVLLFATLFMLAIYDAREHRIPNRCVLLLIVLSLVMKSISSTGTPIVRELGQDGCVGCLFFGFGFILYLVRAMAPGDVKLLGAIGFFVGWGSDTLTEVYYLALGMAIVGGFYYFYFRAQTMHPSIASEVKTTVQQNPFLLINIINQCVGLEHKNHDGGKMANRMPFAPVLVIGLMLYQYFG